MLFARTPVEGNRWIDHRWEMVGLTLAGAETTATADHVLRSSPPLELHGDEAEGYLQNVLADEPSIFFLLRPDEAAEAAGERSAAGRGGECEFSRGGALARRRRHGRTPAAACRLEGSHRRLRSGQSQSRPKRNARSVATPPVETGMSARD